MVFTGEQRSSVDSDENYDSELPALRDYTYGHYPDPNTQDSELFLGSIEPPTFNDAAFDDSGYYSFGGYGHDYSSTCSHQPPQQAPEGNEPAPFAAISAGDPNFLGIGSNFVADPGFQVSEPPPIPEIEFSAAASSFGCNTSTGGLALDAGWNQSPYPNRSRDVYLATLGIPTSNGEADYGQRLLAPSFYQGSSSNPGGGGGEYDFPTPTTHAPSSSVGSKSRRQRNPPVPKKKHGCPDCPWSFSQPKGLRRHLESRHANASTKFYTCKCKYQTTQKSNYQRHLGSRSGGHCKEPDIRAVFTCKCGFAGFADVNDQFNHLGECDSVNGKAGRPPRDTEHR
ncbi:hypothetical protein PG985_014403 [Apiospora marii]|uniref:uncharacterized protein n=1 Tax=Apiospora marii TaxID=335849 RepID=UPI003131F4E9